MRRADREITSRPRIDEIIRGREVCQHHSEREREFVAAALGKLATPLV